MASLEHTDDMLEPHHIVAGLALLSLTSAERLEEVHNLVKHFKNNYSVPAPPDAKKALQLAQEHMGQYIGYLVVASQAYRTEYVTEDEYDSAAKGKYD